MMTGTEFGKALPPTPGQERENFILSVAKAQGLVPITWKKIRIEQTLAGKLRVLEYEVSALPAAIGTVDDPFFFPAWPWTYQAIADGMKCILPTRKMCISIANVAQARIEPHPYTPTDGGKMNETSARFIESNNHIKKDLRSAQLAGKYVPGNLVTGLKKDVVVGPNLDGSKVAIFGWFRPGGKFKDDSASRWQPYSTVHESEYSDYSHSWEVVKESGTLDGSSVLLTDIATDKLFWTLLSDQGPFPLRFPNTSKNVSPPPGYPAGTFAVVEPSKTVAKTAKSAGVVGGIAFGGTIGFAVGGPIGGVVGAVFGAALGRA